MSFFTCVFQGFCLLFSNTYLKKHLWMASSVYLNREASQGCIDVYFLGKHCYQEHLNMKILHSKLFQGEYLFPWGRTYLLVNKYWRSSYFSVNNYRGVLITREYLLTVTPVIWMGWCVAVLIKTELNIYRKEASDCYTLIKPLRIRKKWKGSI